jgi:hypothetical protein
MMYRYVIAKILGSDQFGERPGRIWRIEATSRHDALEQIDREHSDHKQLRIVDSTEGEKLGNRITTERLIELGDLFEEQLKKEAHSPRDLVNALQVLALTFQVRADEIKAEIAERS